MDLVQKVKNLVGFGKAEVKAEEKPPKNMNEVISRLPESFHKYMQKELPYRRASALVFIAIVLGMGTPLWYRTTQTYRAHFDTFSKDMTISLNIRINLAVTNDSLKEEVNSMTKVLLDKLADNEIKTPLKINWSIRNLGLRDLHSVENERIPKSNSLDVFVAIVSPQQWPHFSATNIYLGRGRWAAVLIDVPHLNSIVKRDLREKMQPWQIAALSPSQQKRLIWDSATLSMDYIIQVIHVHDNANSSVISSGNILQVMKVFAKRLEPVTHLQVCPLSSRAH
ncbi:unnamed protein product [Cylicostephanus goldi]|uniref:Uncharacterized protein n=1 Tax=Cylicostephanus goldi TaxID=71465 RepID=A0A3P6R8Z2_CYLGO|nr:unnamed protein product [Cylicostephanus goldi]